MNKVCVLTLMLALLAAVSCEKPDRTAKLAEYLIQEKRLRDSIRDSIVLADSLMRLQMEYSIDVEQEFSRLRNNPKDWPAFLRKLRGG